MIKRAARPDSHFLIIRNDVVRDQRLTYCARGLLAAILSRPDNWTVSAEQLARETEPKHKPTAKVPDPPKKEGIKTIREALRELEQAGYLQRHRVRGEDGRFTWVQVIYDTPRQVVSAGQTISPSPHYGEAPTARGTSKEDLVRSTDQEDETNCPAPSGRGRASENQSALTLVPPLSDNAEGDGDAYEDWRSQDRELFRSIVGDVLASDGSRWKAGTFTADAFYEAFRKNPRKPMKWPGQYFRRLEENNGMEDWLTMQGLEAA